MKRMPEVRWISHRERPQRRAKAVKIPMDIRIGQSRGERARMTIPMNLKQRKSLPRTLKSEPERRDRMRMQ